MEGRGRGPGAPGLRGLLEQVTRLESRQDVQLELDRALAGHEGVEQYLEGCYKFAPSCSRPPLVVLELDS